MAVEAQGASYTCPMDPEVVRDEPGHCPECGMKLLPGQLVSEAAAGSELERRSAPSVTRPRGPRLGGPGLLSRGS